MKRIIPVLAAIVLSLLVAASAVGCGGGGKATPTPTPTPVTSLELVPAGVDLVVEVKLSQILEDKDLTGIYTSIDTGIYNFLLPYQDMPPTFEAALDMVEEQIGLDLRDLKEVVFFGNVAQAIGGGDYFAGIITGTFDKNKFIAAIERGGEVELSPIDYNGYEIYTDEEQEGAFSFLSDKVFVLGRMQPVKDVIDVREGDKLALSGKVLNTYNELGDAWIKVAWEPMPELLEQAREALPPEIPVNMAPLLNLEATGLAFAKAEQSLSIAFKSLYPSSEAAEDAETALNALMMLVPLMPAEGPVQLVAPLLDKIEISASGSWLTIAFKITPAEVGELIRTLGGMQYE